MNGNDRRREWENVGNRRRDFYIYEAETIAIVVGTLTNDVINIEADSDFILQKLTFQADLAGVAQAEATRVIPNVLVQLTDTGSGRQLSHDFRFVNIEHAASIFDCFPGSQ